MSKQRH